MHDRQFEEPEEEEAKLDKGSKAALSLFTIVLVILFIVFMLIVLAAGLWLLGILILGIQSLWGIIFNLGIITLGIV